MFRCVALVVLFLFSFFPVAQASYKFAKVLSVRGLGLGGATVATSFDPSAVYHNPALLLDVEGYQVVVGNSFHISNIKMVADVNNVHRSFIHSPSHTPHVFFATNKLSPLGLGLGLYMPTTETVHFLYGPGLGHATLGGSYYRQSQWFQTTLALAYDFVERFSFGGSFTSSYSSWHYQGDTTPESGLISTEQADAFAYGYSVGMSIKGRNNRDRIGLHYRSGYNVGYIGEGSVDDIREALSMDFSSGGDLNVGIALQPFDGSDFLMSIQGAWLNLSNESNYIRRYPTQPRSEMTLDSKDILEVGVGVEYGLYSNFTVRGGYHYSPVSVPDRGLHPVFPDTAKHMGSVGISFSISKNFVWHCAYAYSSSPTRKDPGGTVTTNNGTYDSEEHFVSLGVQYGI